MPTDRIQNFLAEQQRLFSEKSMTRDEVKALLAEMIPPWVLQMDRTPPRVGGAILNYENGAATWAGSQPYSGEAWEWDTTVAENVVTAAGGKVKFSTGTLPSVEPDPLTIDFTGVAVDATRFLFVETVVPNGTIELKIQEDRPVDDPASSTYRKALSIWKMTAKGPVKIKTLFRGEIDYSALNTP